VSGIELAASRPAGGRTARLYERQIRHADEMQDWLNGRVYHPLARQLAALLVPTGITPNMVSVASGLMVVVAGIFYVGLSWPLSALLGFTAHLSWHVLDGADGDLARRTGRVSPVGELVDGVCDYFGHIILYVMLAASLAAAGAGGWAWALAAVSGAARIVQVNHTEGQRRAYLWRVYGTPWLKNAYEASGEGLGTGTLFTRLFGPFARLYVAIASVDNPLSERIDALVLRSEGKPVERERVSRICRRVARKAIRVQTHLGANSRTIALGISMIIGSPLWFFLYESVLLTLVLLWSRRLQRRCDLTILARLGS
jgi:hypothetical protein